MSKRRNKMNTMIETRPLDGENIETMINLDRYPVLDLTTEAGAGFASKCRQQYLDTGLCTLPEFILPDALETLAEEANSIADQAFFCNSTHNAYLSDDDSALPEDDVARLREQTYVGSVPYDCIDLSAGLRRLYQWEPLKDFIGYVLGKKQFYRFADPLGALSINVFVDGGEHGWHFDESEYTVTLMLQPPEQGGEFEYVPQIRELSNEKEIVAGVLSGNREGVVKLPFTAGTLLIFGGRQTIHRVTRVKGAKPRLVPVLCYSERPDMVNSESVRKLFWGRSDSKRATAP